MSRAIAEIEGRRILVTGAANGIGRAVVTSAIRAGAHVMAVDVDEAGLSSLASELPSGSSCRVVDLRDVQGFADLCAATEQAIGGIDALVHVAGVIRRMDLEDITEADWDLQHDVNLKSTFFLCREVARTMRRSLTRGSLVTFTSQGWWTGGFGGSVAYAASKGGVVSLTRGLSRTFAQDGIRVNAIAPGGVATAMMQDGLTSEDLAAFTAQIPLGRLAEPDEIAGIALYLVSDASSYMTGATINASGGQLSY